MVVQTNEYISLHKYKYKETIRQKTWHWTDHFQKVLRSDHGTLLKEETVALSLDEPLTDMGRQRAVSTQEGNRDYSNTHRQ